MEVACEHCWAQRTSTVAGLLAPRPAITSLMPPNQEREKGSHSLPLVALLEVRGPWITSIFFEVSGMLKMRKVAVTVV